MFSPHSRLRFEIPPTVVTLAVRGVLFGCDRSAGSFGRQAELVTNILNMTMPVTTVASLAWLDSRSFATLKCRLQVFRKTPTNTSSAPLVDGLF